MDTRLDNVREFQVALNCNLSKNQYEVIGDCGLFLSKEPRTGNYDELIRKISVAAHGRYADMLRTCFSSEELISTFEADRSHIFSNGFFKYTPSSSKPTATEWAGIVCNITSRVGRDVIANIYIHTIGEMYNECETAFADTDMPEGARITFDYEGCKLALVFDAENGNYSIIGGSMYARGALPLQKEGFIQDVLQVFSSLMIMDLESSFMDVRSLLDQTVSACDAYGGYYCKRYMMDTDGCAKWHELAILCLNEQENQYLLTLKDIDNMVSQKLYGAASLYNEGSGKGLSINEFIEAGNKCSMQMIAQIPTPFCCISLEPGFPVRVANEAFYRVIGYTPEGFEQRISNNLFSLCHPADLPYLRHLTKVSLEKSQDYMDIETRIIRGDGNIRWFKIHCSYVFAPNEILGFLSGEDITEKKMTEQSEMSGQNSFSQTYSKSTNILFDYDFNTHVLKDRGGLCDTLGFPPENPAFNSFALSGDFVHPDDTMEFKRIVSSLRSGSESVSGSLRIRIPKYNDEYARINVTLSVIFDHKGLPRQVIGVVDKLTTQKKIVATTDEVTPSDNKLFKIDMNNPMMKDVLTNYTVNLTTDTVESYTGLKTHGINMPDFTGQSINESIRKASEMLIDESFRAEFVKTFNTANLLSEYDKNNTDLTNVFLLAHPALANEWVKIFTHMKYDEADGCVRALVYACDVSEEYRKISALESTSYKDPLTGLHNRAHAHDIIDNYLSTMPDDELCALLMIDLDNFKEINDIYGHQTGDEYLRDFANALSDYLPDAFIARLGGDEFVIFLKRCTSISQISNTALTILKIIKDVNHSRITAFNTTGSIGIGLAPAHGRDFDTLYHNADAALYEVKKNNKDGFMFCDDDNPTVHHSSEKRTTIWGRLVNRVKESNRLLLTLLAASMLMAFVITVDIFESSTSEIYDQADETVTAHTMLASKYIDLFINEKFNDARIITNYITQNQDNLMKRDSRSIISADSYISGYNFSEIYFIADDGTEYYHYGIHSPGTSQATLQDSLLMDADNIPIKLRSMPVPVGTSVIAQSVYNSDYQKTGTIFCFIGAEDLTACMSELVSYNDELLCLVSYNGNVIASSYGHYDEFYCHNISEYLTAEGFRGASDITGQIETTDSVNKPSLKLKDTGYLLSGNVIKIRSTLATKEYNVVMVVPQTSLLSNVTLSMRLIFGLVVCLCLTVLVIAWLIVRSTRRSSKYVDSLAYKDSLTSLNNMNYLVDNSKTLLRKCGEPSGIVSLNVDNFRIIRDAYGPAKSNKLITCIGNAISDFLGDTESAGRIVDDRYCLILTYNGETAFTNKLKDLRSYIFSSCATYMASPINFTLSMGVYVSESSDESIKQSYDFADLARIYLKDSANSDGIYFYDERLQKDIQKQKLIEDSLDAALENAEFVPYFQPIVTVFGGQTVAAEALARWVKPDGTIVPPFEFIPLLEKRGTIVNLDYYIFERVCAQLQIWKDTPLGQMSVSINMSRQHFYQPDFIERLMRTTAKYSIPNSRIHIEITESVYIGDSDLINKVLVELRDNGFLISMDDFGTGYSSMSMLQSMPIDILKIDKQFLDTSLASGNGIIVLDGIVNISKQLGLKTICEGVETSKQLNWLKTVGCDMVQGYYYSKPVPSRDFEKFFMENLETNS